MSKALKESVIAVIYGGRSAEREVSLQSGPLVIAGLKEKGYQVVGIDLFGENGDLAPVSQLQSAEFDFAFIALHGGEGEDGRIQALLELLNKPYTGSSPLACGLAMDKILSKRYWHGIGIPTPAYMSFVKDADANLIEKRMSYPIIVKPSREGSTIGINKACNRAELESALHKALEYDSDILVEAFVDGPEFTVAIIDDQAYPVIGLKASSEHELYDYEAKYVADDTEYLLPSGLSLEDEERVKALSLEAYRSLSCSGWGRVDIMRDQQGTFWVLEVNTAPGMTSHSLVPMAAKHLGVDYASLVENIALTAWYQQGTHE